MLNIRIKLTNSIFPLLRVVLDRFESIQNVATFHRLNLTQLFFREFIFFLFRGWQNVLKFNPVFQLEIWICCKLNLRQLTFLVWRRQQLLSLWLVCASCSPHYSSAEPVAQRWSHSSQSNPGPGTSAAELCVKIVQQKPPWTALTFSVSSSDDVWSILVLLSFPKSFNRFNLSFKASAACCGTTE